MVIVFKSHETFQMQILIILNQSLEQKYNQPTGYHVIQPASRDCDVQYALRMQSH